MADMNVDINETEIFNLYPEVLDTLLKDHTTGRNIFWTTDSYAHRGEGFQYSDTITVEHIIGENGMVIRPRALKSKDEQTERTKEMAEVFTPSWVCNVQNNLVDEAWFGRKDVFNTIDDAQHTWMANSDRISFPDNKTWKSYVRATRMEITCGEAPYLVSRYDTTTGLPIELNQRIGMLDRKLRVVSENTETSGESDIGISQFISLLVVKSCIGTLAQVSRGLCWVAFNVPNIHLANFDLTYLRHRSACWASVNLPMLRKVSVCPITGTPITGVLSTSPIAPVPLASGTRTLYDSQYPSVGKVYRFSIHL